MLVDGFVIGVDLPPVIELVEAQGVLVQVPVADGCDGVRKVEAQGQSKAAGEGTRVAEVGVGGQVRRGDAGAHALAQLVGVGDGLFGDTAGLHDEGDPAFDGDLVLGGIRLGEFVNEVLHVDAPPPVDFQVDVARVLVRVGRRGNPRVVQPSQEEWQGAFGDLVAVHGLILRGVWGIWDEAGAALRIRVRRAVA